MTKIITFSSSGLYSLPHDNIDILSSTIVINDIEDYLEGVEIKSQELNQRLSLSMNLNVYINYPYINDIKCCIEQYISQGYDTLLFIVGVIDGFDILPKLNLIKEEYTSINIYIYETDSVGYTTSYLALEAKKLIDAETQIDKVFEELNVIKNNSNVYLLEENVGFKFQIYRVEKSKIVKLYKMSIKDFGNFVHNEIQDDGIMTYILNFKDDETVLNQLEKISYKKPRSYYMSPTVRFYFKNNVYGFGYISKLNKSISKN